MERRPESNALFAIRPSRDERRRVLRLGDVVDCWRVEAFEEPRRLLLTAEMRMPGRAWLEFSVAPREGGSTLRQTAIFDPVGWLGLAYWYSLYVVHEFVFAGMLRNMARAAERGGKGVSL